MSAVGGTSPVATGAHYEVEGTDNHDNETWSGLERYAFSVCQLWKPSGREEVVV